MDRNVTEYFLNEKTGKQIVDSLPFAAYITDFKGRIEYHNSAAVKLWGQNPGLDTRQWYMNLKLYYADGTPMPAEENPFASFPKNEEDHSENEIIVAQNGERRWLKIYQSRMHDENGKTIGTLNMLIDITDQKEIEKQIRKSESEFSDFFDNTAVGLHQTQSDGVIRRANQTVLDMLGYSREELVGKSIADLHADEEVLAEIMEKLSAGEEIHDLEIRLKHKDGSIRHVLLNSSGYWKDGELVHSQCITRDITERKQAQKRIKRITAKSKRQQRLYEAILSSTPDLVYVFDLNYRFTFANDALLEMWGLSRDDYMGKSMQHIGYEEWHADMHEREIDQVIATKEPVQGEVSFPHAKLGSRFYHYIFVPVINNDGMVEAVAGTTRDITQRKQVEENLRKSEEKYRTLVENFPNGAVGLFDQDLRYSAIGGEFLGLTDIDPNDRLGKKITDIYPDELTEKIKPYFQAALNGKKSSFEVEFQNRQLSVQTLPVEKEKGEIIGGMVVAQDVTKRKQAKKALRKSEEKYRTLIERMNDGFVILKMEFDKNNDPVDWRYLETNPAADKHAGLSNREGKRVSEVLPDLEQDWLKIYGKVAMTGEAVQFENYHKNLERWFEISAFHIGDPEGRKVAVFFKNITERKQAQEKLQKMNETLEERVKKRTQSLLSYQEQLRKLAYQLSRAEENQRQQLATELHDNLGQMLALGKMKVNELQKGHFTDKVTPAIDDLKKIIDNAITYTQEMTSDLKPPPSVENDLRASLNWLAEKMAEHGLEVTIDDEAQSKLLDNEVRTTVLQSIRELLFNVIKHTAEKKATVHLRNIEDQLQVTVEDEGKGFNSDNKKLVSIKDGGFGLFNVHERIDLLGGRIEIKSEQGRGTKVSLFVPLSKQSKSDKKVKQPKSDGSTTEVQPLQAHHEEKIKVLLADDHKMFRNGLRKIIMDEDDIVVVGEAGNGEEAVTLSRKTSPDVILMDVSMPRMDGIEATKKISSEIPDVQIIGVSLHESQEIVQDMRNAGASAYLTKTEAFESLILTIRAEASSLKK